MTENLNEETSGSRRRGFRLTDWGLPQEQLTKLLIDLLPPSIEEVRQAVCAPHQIHDSWVAVQFEKLAPEFFVFGDSRRYFVAIIDGANESYGYLIQRITGIEKKNISSYAFSFVPMAPDDGLSHSMEVVGVPPDGTERKIYISFFSAGLSLLEQEVQDGQILLMPPVEYLVARASRADMGIVTMLGFDQKKLILDFQRPYDQGMVHVAVPSFSSIARYWFCIKGADDVVYRVRMFCRDVVTIKVPFSEPKHVDLEVITLEKGKYVRYFYAGPAVLIDKGKSWGHDPLPEYQVSLEIHDTK